jgi:hypothetical protein
MSIDFKILKAMSTALNNAKLTSKIKTVGVKTEALKVGFIKAIDSIFDDGRDSEIPDEVYDFYESIPLDEEKKQEDEKPEPERKPKKTIGKKKTTTKKTKEKPVDKPEEKVVEDEGKSSEDDCPGIGVDYDPKTKECQHCKENFLKDFKECKETFNTNKKNKEKAKKTKKENVKKENVKKEKTKKVEPKLKNVEEKKLEPKKQISEKIESIDEILDKVVNCLPQNKKEVYSESIVKLTKKLCDVKNGDNIAKNTLVFIVNQLTQRI